MRIMSENSHCHNDRTDSTNSNKRNGTTLIVIVVTVLIKAVI